VYFVALAADYDGTLASDGVVPSATLATLEDVRRSGRRLLRVTGRELPDLKSCFPALDLFDLVVAENGALLFDPRSEEETLLGPPPNVELVRRLEAAGVEPLSVGRSIIATWEPNELAVLAAIHQLGLEQQVIFNKGAVMVLAAGVNKATGLAHALERLRLSPHNVVGIATPRTITHFSRCAA
jgi:hydroxymethylpyrimidine pyrophosphatase-like HAD family hydrolase